MLFDVGSDVFESEKERNLYYKVFAGHLFNEHVPGVEDRVQAFCRLLDETPRRGQAATPDPVILDPATAHVSFDNHAYRFELGDSDRGEFADILVHDRPSRTVITIEAKVHSDWTFEKDILANERRIAAIEARMPGVRFVPCLLVSESKWREVQRMENHASSQYRQFTGSEINRFRVLLWEELRDLCGSDRLARFVDNALADRRGMAVYGFDGGWFARQAG